ncbi:MAG: hypothetical protein V8S24_01830 [Gordonibacter pamelaeae]
MVRVPAGDDALRGGAVSGRGPLGRAARGGDPLGVFGGDAVLGIAVALALFAALAILGAAWFSKREAA